MPLQSVESSMIPTAETASVEPAPSRLESIEPACEIPSAQDVSERLDPYRPWLGIADPQRPLDHYVLLGLDPDERDPEKIRDLAQRQRDRVLAHVRRLLAELEAARDCLCDPQQRQEYDAQLRERAKVGSPPAAIAAPEAPVEGAPPRWESIEPTGVTPAEQDVFEPLDPYRRWLKIRDRQRPLDHYALLGLAPGEFDREKIWRRAQRQMGRLLKLDPTLGSPYVRRIFAEVEAARDCLCNPRTRHVYDAQLPEWPPGDLAPPEQDLSEPNDCYSEWLGITDRHWPLDYYVLLGTDPGESDREKIWRRAERQLARLREVDPALEWCRRVYDEVEAARDCLCNPQMRQEYDAQLRLESIEPARVTSVEQDLSEPFNPYREWLGITDPRWPLDHYVLLGVDPGESDQEKIWRLAERQIDRLLEVDPSLEIPQVRQIFAELEAARDCLCDPQKRQEYDAQLPQRSIEAPVAAPVEPAPARLESFDPSCVILPEDDPSEFFVATPAQPTRAQPTPARLESIEPARVTSPEHDVQDPRDPYREWLGIADPQRPLNHYLLLGLTPYETDLAKIDEISLRQMARVLERDSALNTETGVRLFGELDKARNCLCDPEQKQAYDDYLREGRDGEPSAGVAPRTTARATPESSLNLAPRAAAIPHEVRDERISASVAAAADTFVRHVSSHDAPAPARPPAPRPWYVRHSRLALAVLAGMLVVAAIANYPTGRKSREEDLVPTLLAKLNHSNSQQRIEAAQALRELGPQARIGLPHMLRVLSEESDEDVRLAVVQAVREFGPATAVYRRDFEIIKNKETNSGVREILNELTKQ